MKKRVVILLVLILALAMVLSGCAANNYSKNAFKFDQAANDTAKFVSGTTPYETLVDFVANNKNRTSGYIEVINDINVDHALKAANWISEKFVEMGYLATYENPLQEFYYNNPFTNKSEKGYNVVFKKESASDKKVVIGAYYDNVTALVLDGKVLGGDGTYASGVGIATLIETAKALKDKNLPFDVEFVAFGANEPGGFGCLNYLEGQNKKEDILLMVNFDRNAIGEYVYMYSSEAKTKHNEFFYNKAKESNLYVADLPKNLSPALLANASSNGVYVNEAMYSNSEKFLRNDINVVNFISMNFSAKGKVCEIEGKDNILYTQNDNLENVIQRCGGESVAPLVISRQINSAISTVVYAFEDENFVNTMQDSKANGGKDWLLQATTVSYIAYGILGGLIVLLIILYFALRGGTKKHDVYINTIYGRVNAKTGQIVGQNNEPINNENIASDLEKIFKDFQDNAQNNNRNSEDKNDINNNSGDKDKDIFGDY